MKYCVYSTVAVEWKHRTSIPLVLKQSEVRLFSLYKASTFSRFQEEVSTVHHIMIELLILCNGLLEILSYTSSSGKE